MRMYHVTPTHNLPSILTLGLITNFNPTPWIMESARDRGYRGIYLCMSELRSQYWSNTMYDGWIDLPRNEDLSRLVVNCEELVLRGDESRDDHYHGDFLCDGPIPPDRVVEIRRLS